MASHNMSSCSFNKIKQQKQDTVTKIWQWGHKHNTNQLSIHCQFIGPQHKPVMYTKIKKILRSVTITPHGIPVECITQHIINNP